MIKNENKTSKTMLCEQNNIPSDSFLTLSYPGAPQQLTTPTTNKQNTSKGIDTAKLAKFKAKNSRYTLEQRTTQKQYTSGEMMSVVLKRAKRGRN